MKSITLLSLAFLALSLNSCKKDKDKEQGNSPQAVGNCSVKLAHNWEGAANPFFMHTEYINHLNNDSLTFTTLKYYISNIKLKKSDGSWYVQPDSYYLVDPTDNAIISINLSGIPVGDYTDLEYTFGVDSLKNVSGAQAGALSPSHGMFWNWNTGYIMSKAEGTSPNSTYGSFAFHLGGFSGINSVVLTRTINLSGLNTMTVSSGSSTEIGISVDVSKMVSSGLSLAETSSIQSTGPKAKSMATAFLTGITLGYVHD